MKFGTTLRRSVYSPWKAQYIDYDKLKKLLKEQQIAQKKAEKAKEKAAAGEAAPSAGA